MELFPVGALAEHVAWLTTLVENIRIAPTPEQRGALAQILHDKAEVLRHHCEGSRFVNCTHQATLLVALVTRDHEHEQYANQVGLRLRELYLALVADLKGSMFLRLDAHEVRLYDCPSLFGPEIDDAFPTAAYDLREAGNCYALGRPTASVFHLMCALEWVIRALAKRLGVRESVYRSEPGGTIIHHINGKLRERLTKMQPRKRKNSSVRARYELLSEVAVCLERTKDAWRNKVSHGRERYDATQAFAIMGAVKDVMEIAIRAGVRQTRT